MNGDSQITIIRSSPLKALALSAACVAYIFFLNVWSEPVSAQPECADIVGHLTAMPSTIDRETSPVTTNLMWSVDVKRCPISPIVTLERRTVPFEHHTVARETPCGRPTCRLKGQMSATVTRTTLFVLRTENRDLANATVTVNGDPGLITVSFGKQLTADDITKFNQQWMQPWSKEEALGFARFTMFTLDSSGDTSTGERMAAMVRMFDLTKDTIYLDHLLDLIQVALKFRDDRPLDSGPNVFRPPDQIRNRLGLPAWGGEDCSTTTGCTVSRSSHQAFTPIRSRPSPASSRKIRRYKRAMNASSSLLARQLCQLKAAATPYSTPTASSRLSASFCHRFTNSVWAMSSKRC
jgi:hypothetical protein